MAAKRGPSFFTRWRSTNCIESLQFLDNLFGFAFGPTLPIEPSAHGVHDAREFRKQVFPITFCEIRHLNGASRLCQQYFEIAETKASGSVLVCYHNEIRFGVREQS